MQALPGKQRRRHQTDRHGSLTVEDLEPRLLLATFRTIDGAGNNPTPPGADFGVAGTPLIRFGYDAFYPDGFGDQITSATAPNPRDVSNAISTQDEPVFNDRNLSDWVVQWGQFLTHDMDLTGNSAANNVLSTGGTGDFGIPINGVNDPLGPGPIPFNRSDFDPGTGTDTMVGPPGNQRPNWREQMNDITSFIDASNVYGSDAARAVNLRTFVDGKLKTTAGGLLPGLNDVGEENDNAVGHPAAELFLAGDVRSNEQVGLTATHALFIREHNRLADLIKTQAPTLNDEQIYQWARKIVGAEMQIITYEEFLPALMGSSAPDPAAYTYNQFVDPSITTSFSTAFFRFGHSMQSSNLQLVNNDGSREGSLSLAGIFFNPDILKNDPTLVDQVMKGLASQVAQENDALLVDDIRNFLFGPPGAGGLDLGALDIQRGRDHGLLDFNAFRVAYRVPPLNSFNQLTSDPILRVQLQTLYGNINNVDAWVGGIVENHLAGQSIGLMLTRSFQDQFQRLRDGDRFFYTGDVDLNDALVTSVIDLDNLTLAQVIRNNTGITNIQNDVFFTASGFSTVQTDSDTVVTEAGTTDTFSVSLNRAPASNVVLTVVSDDTGEATVSHATLTFTPADWSIPQFVTVTGVDDAAGDGDQLTTITVSVADAVSDDAFDNLSDQTVVATTVDDDLSDLKATAFNAVSDHVPGGRTDVTFSLKNTGTVAATAFETHVVWSPNSVVGDADDVFVAGSTSSFSGLAQGAAVTRTISVQMDLELLYQHAHDSDAPGQAVGTESLDVSNLFLIVDSGNSVTEADETNNSGQGHLIDSDDITYFPWDKNGNGTIEPLEALGSIQSIGSSDSINDFDGNTIVTPLEALGTLQRIGYERDNSVIGDAPGFTASVSKTAPSTPVAAFMASALSAPVQAAMEAAEADAVSNIVAEFFPESEMLMATVVGDDDEEHDRLFASGTPEEFPVTVSESVAADDIDHRFAEATNWLDVV